VGDRTADEHHVKHSRQDNVGDELPLSDEEPLILAPEDRAADEARGTSVGHARVLARFLASNEPLAMHSSRALSRSGFTLPVGSFFGHNAAEAASRIGK